MTIQAVRCESCGGTLAFPEGKPSPECSFCGSTHQVQIPIDRSIPQPHFVIGFSISDEEADQSFRTFAQSSFWYPKDIRNAELELKRIYLPAWVWKEYIETHYNGLISASSESGKKPISGIQKTQYDQVLIPSSKAVSQQELNGIAPFPYEKVHRFDEELLEYPYELGELTERIALSQCQVLMQNTHLSAISNHLSIQKIRGSSVYSDLKGTPAVLPVFIGVYTRKNKYYRIIINGSTGRLVGDAPFDWIKLFIIISIVAITIFILMNVLS